MLLRQPRTKDFFEILGRCAKRKRDSAQPENAKRKRDSAKPEKNDGPRADVCYVNRLLLYSCLYRRLRCRRRIVRNRRNKERTAVIPFLSRSSRCSFPFRLW